MFQAEAVASVIAKPNVVASRSKVEGRRFFGSIKDPLK
jgi:hypothetical protein